VSNANSNSPLSDPQVNELFALERRRCVALVKKDMQSLRSLIGERVVHIHASGRRDDYDSYMELVEKKLDFLDAQRGELDVVIYGPCAVMTGSQSIVVRKPGETGDGSRVEANVTQTWVRQKDGGWRQVSFQATPLTPSPPAK
jgi:ketosteroid isomerase-like protein